MDSAWSLIILIGATQGLFLAFYFFRRPENRSANKWLALLLAVVSLHLLEYALDIAAVSLSYPAIIASTYPLLFCMGPLFFLYCRSLLTPGNRFTLKNTLHFVPALLVLLLMLPFYLMPPDLKVAFIQGIGQDGGVKIPVEQLVFMAAHAAQTMAYVFGASKFLRKKELSLKNYSSDAIAVKKLAWLNSFSQFFLVYLALYLIVVVVLTQVSSFQVELDYVLLLIISISIYAIGYSAIDNPDVFKSIPADNARNGDGQPRISGKLPGLKEKLLDVMETNKPYKKSDLRISDLSDDLAVPSYQLSQVINDEFGVNFYEFVNKYRVEDAKKLLIDNEKNLKILAIAFEVGFNSKATFNRVFKNLTDFTPSEFQERFSPKNQVSTS